MHSSSRPHILSVEDHPDVRDILHELLQGPYDLTLASSAEEALRLLGDKTVSLFLLDIRLGHGRSGVELLRALRDLGPATDVPAVALTTYGMKGDREALLEAGFDGYVSKPFTKAELIGAIDRALAGPAPTSGRS